MIKIIILYLNLYQIFKKILHIKGVPYEKRYYYLYNNNYIFIIIIFIILIKDEFLNSKLI